MDKLYLKNIFVVILKLVIHFHNKTDVVRSVYPDLCIKY